jgi:RNA polymerase sigma-54 factor
MLKQNLSQKLQQKLSPQQLMFVKLLELNTLSFEQRLEDEMIENPALEAGKDDDEIIPEFAEDNFEGNDNETDTEEITPSDFDDSEIEELDKSIENR